MRPSTASHRPLAPPAPSAPVARPTPLNTAFAPAAISRPSVAAAATPSGAASTSVSIPPGSVSVVLLAGGVGKRMGASIPKQYLELKGQPIATYSLEMFGQMQEVGEIVIVCDPSWKDVFEKRLGNLSKHIKIKWALPGKERQDSVFNGLQQTAESAELVAVHDSARPLATPEDVRKCMLDAMRVGAAVLGVPVKPTIKEVDAGMNVVKTLQRAKLWEVQTPQIIRPKLLKQGFELVKSKNLEVTDDVSIIEAMGRPVLLTPGKPSPLFLVQRPCAWGNLFEGLLCHGLASGAQKTCATDTPENSGRRSRSLAPPLLTSASVALPRP